MIDPAVRLQTCIDLLACPVCHEPATPKGTPQWTCLKCKHPFLYSDDILDVYSVPAARKDRDDFAQAQYYDKGKAAELDQGRKRLKTMHQNKADRLLQSLQQLRATRDRLRICEIGLGTGLHASWLLDQCPVASLIGVDVSRDVLEAGRANWSMHPTLLPVLASAYELPLRAEVLDLVYFSGALHHCASPAIAIREAARVLKPGGRLILCEPVWYFPSNLYYNLRIREEFGQRLLRRKHLLDWCKHAGLAPLGITHFNYIPQSQHTRALVQRLETVMRNIPGLSRFSSMFFLEAEKTGASG